MTKQRTRSARFVRCVHRGEYEADLIVSKIYRVVTATRRDRPSDIRILDESGEDYLYPQEWFVPVDPPLKTKKALTTIPR